jgi:hypothetical protein
LLVRNQSAEGGIQIETLRDHFSFDQTVVVVDGVSIHLGNLMLVAGISDALYRIPIVIGGVHLPDIISQGDASVENVLATQVRTE